MSIHQRMTRGHRQGMFLLEAMLSLGLASGLYVAYHQLSQQLERMHEKTLLVEEVSSCAAWMARSILADPSVLRGPDPIRRIHEEQGPTVPNPRIMWDLEQVPLEGHVSEITVTARHNHPVLGVTEARMVVIVHE